MGLIVNHNLMALNAANNLTTTYSRLSRSVTRLSSGLRIAASRDDAAGLAVRELMRSDIRVLNQGVRNAQDAINMLMTADGAMSVIDEKLIRMKELAEQSATGTYTDAQRTIMNNEFEAMADEITRIAEATDFNGITLLNGALSATGMKIHFGTGNESQEDYYYVSLSDVTATGLGLGAAAYEYLDGQYNFSSQTSAIGGSDGFFGYYYDFDDGADKDLSEIGALFLVQSGQSLQDVRDLVNQGTAARARLNFNENVSNGDRIYIGGLKFQFITAAAAASAGCIAVSMGANTTLANSAAIGLLINVINGLGGANVWAVDSGSNAMYLFAKQAGLGGNDITVATSAAGQAMSITLNGTSISGVANSASLTSGGLSWVTASVITGTSGANTVYNLRLAGVDQQSGGGSGAVVHRVLAVDFGAGDDTGFDVAGTVWVTTGGKVGLDGETTNWSRDYGTAYAVSISTQSAAQAALLYLDTAINTKDGARAVAGYTANRLQNTVTALTIQAENLQASEAAISDADVAQEMTEFTRNLILAQSGVAMLAQANSIANLALQLLGV